MKKSQSYSYWQAVWQQFKHHPLGVVALGIVLLFCVVGIYAPLLASSKPLFVYYDGNAYFPLFRYLFYSGFYTKWLDLFYNLLMFTVPLLIVTWFIFRHHAYLRRLSIGTILLAQVVLFLYFAYRTPQDPAADPTLTHQRQEQLQKQLQEIRLNPYLAQRWLPNWQRDLDFMTPYAKLNLVLRYQQRKNQQDRLEPYAQAYAEAIEKKGQSDTLIPTLWNLDLKNEQAAQATEEETLKKYQASYPQARQTLDIALQHCQGTPTPAGTLCRYLVDLPEEQKKSLQAAQEIVSAYENAQTRLRYRAERHAWLEEQLTKLHAEIMPLVRHFHWEDDAGGSQLLNHFVSWWDLTRINRKDMVASLLFGIRISLSVGLLAVSLALLIGIPIGAIAGFYGGTTDILIYRLTEIWEAMPTFFMLLMIVAFLQSKSIFLVISVIGFFGWTGFSRFIRGEFFRQKQLPYMEACRSLGFSNTYIMFHHLLPNAIPPLLTLVPFAIMGAITSEAGLSFLGLGEEGSSSWGILMDEGRTAFPAESYLLWPPAILLTLLLVSIALVGDALRDALDPKLHQY